MNGSLQSLGVGECCVSLKGGEREVRKAEELRKEVRNVREEIPKCELNEEPVLYPKRPRAFLFTQTLAT
jgi:hypothetical protein